MIRVGMIGVGKMGISHFAVLGAHPDVDLVAVCDSAGYVTSTLQKQTGVQAYKDHKRMLRQAELDAVFIATPTASHYQLARDCIEAGLHLFVEKPLCLDPQQSFELAALAEERNLRCQVGYHNRYVGTFRELHRLVQGGVLGTIHRVEGLALGQVVIRPKKGRTWRTKKSEGGGCLHDYACHVVDLMNFIMGPPEAVKSAQLQSIYSENTEDAVYALFEYASGATGSLSANWSDTTVRKMSTSITVFGTKGKAIADRQDLRVHLSAEEGFESYEKGWNVRYTTELQSPVWFYLRGEEYSSQIEGFVESIQSEGPAVNTFETAAQTDKVIAEIASVGGQS
ncbi:MAG: oxidoreductase [Planctomycetota bacterium]|nr:MAG: oxidoreductase [Planctomycetota bacterium]